MAGSNKGQILTNSSSCQRNCLVNPIYEDYLLKTKKSNNYISPIEDEYLKVDNYFSEYNTHQKQFKARNNLGIEGLAYWGNIQGYVEDQQDLVQYIRTISTELQQQLSEIKTALERQLQQLIKDKISIEISSETEASKQIVYKVKNKDFILNNQYAKAIEYLGDIKSVDDALAVIMYSLFPVEYINWKFKIQNTADTDFTFEKGTTKIINGATTLGTITVQGIPGNRVNIGDTLEDFRVDNNIMQTEGQEEFTYIINVSASDVLGNILSYKDPTTKTKTYTFSMKTTQVNDPIVDTCTVTVRFITTQYTYFLSSTDLISLTSFTGDDIQQYKSTANNYLFNLGNSKQYIYVLSPKKINQVETAAGTTANAASSYMISTGWSQNEVQYIPIGGGEVQRYWLMRLDGTQSNYVRIRIS